MNEPIQQDLLECDLIMKGGTTSGIVYPKAIHHLSQYYRFRSIGGASAGAIAAALTAAAEFGRTANPGVFDQLKGNQHATPVIPRFTIWEILGEIPSCLLGLWPVMLKIRACPLQRLLWPKL